MPRQVKPVNRHSQNARRKKFEWLHNAKRRRQFGQMLEDERRRAAAS